MIFLNWLARASRSCPFQLKIYLLLLAFTSGTFALAGQLMRFLLRRNDKNG